MAERFPGAESGQAQIELIAGLPVLLIAALIAAQLLVAAYAQSIGDGAAEAAAIAVADGRDPEAAARDAAPGWAEGRLSVSIEEDGRVAVEIVAPALIPGLGERLTLGSAAWAMPAAGS